MEITEREKAEQIHKMFLDLFEHRGKWEDAKQCALIAIDLIINSNPSYLSKDRGGNYELHHDDFYWIYVKDILKGM